jgi:hypothetical protein
MSGNRLEDGAGPGDWKGDPRYILEPERMLWDSDPRRLLDHKSWEQHRREQEEAAAAYYYRYYDRVREEEQRQAGRFDVYPPSSSRSLSSVAPSSDPVRAAAAVHPDVPPKPQIQLPLAATQAAPSGVIPLLNARVVQLRFYEGSSFLLDDAKVYARRFARATARYIISQLELTHPERTERADFTLYAVYSRDDGTFIGEHPLDTYIPSDWKESWHSMGWGWASPGNWPEGQYRVDVYCDKQKIASNTFTIDNY